MIQQKDSPPKKWRINGQVGKIVSHYRILEELGRGRMGIIYKTEDNKLDRFVTSKFLTSHISADSEEHKRLELEAKAAASLNNPNSATIHGIEQSEGETFIVTTLAANKP